MYKYNSHLITFPSSEALQKMSAGFHSKALRYEALPLADLLLFDGAKDIQETCQTRGLNISEKGILFDKTAYKDIDKVKKIYI